MKTFIKIVNKKSINHLSLEFRTEHEKELKKAHSPFIYNLKNPQLNVLVQREVKQYLNLGYKKLQLKGSDYFIIVKK